MNVTSAESLSLVTLTFPCTREYITGGYELWGEISIGISVGKSSATSQFERTRGRYTAICCCIKKSSPRTLWLQTVHGSVSVSVSQEFRSDSVLQSWLRVSGETAVRKSGRAAGSRSLYWRRVCFHVAPSHSWKVSASCWQGPSAPSHVGFSTR